MTRGSSFAEMLRLLRMTAGLTQEELAGAAGLSTRAISDLERGVNVTARRETARLLADALGLAGESRADFEAASRGRRPGQAASSPGGAAIAPRYALSAGGNSRQCGLGDAENCRARLSRWHFPGDEAVTLACQRLPPDRCPPSSDRRDPNYIRFSDMADLDTLIDVYGAASTYNPVSRITITAAQDLTYADAGSHLVVIGGLAWNTVSVWISRILSIPVVQDDPRDRRAITIRDPDGSENAFSYVLDQDEVVEDVGFFASGVNPSAPHCTLTVCGGITTRGVRGAARCFIDPAVRVRNENYVATRFPGASFYCIAMRVPIVNGDPLAPDLFKQENRLHEWATPAPAAPKRADQR